MTNKAVQQLEKTMGSEQQMLDHLIKEIEMITNNIIAFRTKAAFTVWIGPYLILGSVIIAKKGTFPVTMTYEILIALILICALYFLLGLFAGLVEQSAWKRCNALRKIIIEIYPDKYRESLKKHLPEHKSEKYAITSYLLMFLIIGISFSAVLFLVFETKLV